MKGRGYIKTQRRAELQQHLCKVCLEKISTRVYTTDLSELSLIIYYIKIYLQIWEKRPKESENLFFPEQNQASQQQQQLKAA